VTSDSHSHSTDFNLSDSNGNFVEIIESYLTSNHVWVRNQDDGSSRVIKTSELRRGCR
jgi:hypothetical protein